MSLSKSMLKKLEPSRSRVIGPQFGNLDYEIKLLKSCTNDRFNDHKNK